MKINVKVDTVGRLVLPKRIREAIGVFGPTRLTVDVIDGVACMSVPAPQSTPLSRKGGRMVYAGSLPEDWDSGEAISRMRQQKIFR